MPKRTKKKNKTKEELLQTQRELSVLYKIVSTIRLAKNTKQLLRIIKTVLPDLCQAGSIQINSYAKKNRSGLIYYHSLSIQNNTQTLCFYKSSKWKPEQKKILKKTAIAIEDMLKQQETVHCLRQQKEQWELAFDTISAPICLTDLQGNIIRTNKTFRQKTGKPKTELLQKNYFQAFFGKPEPEGSPDASSIKRQVRPVGGREECYEIFLQKIPQKTGQSFQLAALRDITEQISMERQLAQTAQSKEMSIISNSIAHELNNPISGIISVLQTIIMKQQTEDSTALKDLHEMLTAGQRCAKIINQFLNIPGETSLKSCSKEIENDESPSSGP